MNVQNRWGRFLMLAAICTLCMAALSGCGGSQAGQQEAVQPTPQQAEPEGNSETGKIAVPKKTIGWVDATLDGAYQQRLYNAFKAATDHLGWEVKVVDTQGDPQKAATGISTLVTSRVDAIILSAIELNTIRTGLLDAKNAGIPVIELGGGVEPSLFEELGVFNFSEDEEALAEPLAEQMAKDLPAGAKVGILGNSFLYAGTLRVNKFTEVAQSAGLDVVEVLETDFSYKSGEQNASTLLTKYPDLAAIVPVFDFWTAATVNVIKNNGRQNEVKVYSFYADAINNPIMHQNENVAGLTDLNGVDMPLIAADQLVMFFAENKDIDPNAVEGKLTYAVITRDNMVPENQDGPISIEDAVKPYIEAWDQKYSYPSP